VDIRTGTVYLAHGRRIIRSRQHTQANVDHAMLHGVDEQTNQSVQFIPENELELVNAPAILSFHARVNHFFAATSTNFFISADMLPM